MGSFPENEYRSTIRITNDSDECDSTDSAVLEAEPTSGVQQHIHYVAEWLESSLVRFYDPSESTRVELVAALLASHQQVHFCVDTSRGGAGVARMPNAIDLSLLAREKSDAAKPLLLVSPTSAEDREQLHRLCFDRVVVAAIASSLERRDLISGLIPLIPWLRKPEAFDAELRNVSAKMFDRLQKYTRAVLIPGDHGSHWSVYSAPKLTPLWSQIGFPHEPFDDDVCARPVPMSGTIAYETESCESGLVCFAGLDSLEQPSHVASILRQENAMNLLIDAAYFRDAHDSGLVTIRTENRDLVLITPDSGLNRIELMNEFWGQNCLIALFTGMSRMDLAEFLQVNGTWLATPRDLHFQLSALDSDAQAF
ncbi:MAG: hypothetical protein O3A00_26550, partial [Planctomycetota bacterium]|nr:hypothetical protein [Planctomycetota bacterium]